MLSAPDFQKKQIVFVFFNEGEKLSFQNDNLLVKTAEGKTKLQVTCYRLFLVFAVGHGSVTSVLIQKANQFGFMIALMTPGYRLYAMLGNAKEGNTLLHKKQYAYTGLDIAKHIVANKISAQYRQLMEVRNKTPQLQEALLQLKNCYEQAETVTELHSLLAYEGIASKVYFARHFEGIPWQGRQPRIKKDNINSILDIGYTLLFTYLDALLSAFGFDTYCGVYHTMFYMRKSLVCDMVEPFRCLIDKAVKKAYNLKQIKEEDFLVKNHQYRLKWEKNAAYVGFLMAPIIENKDEIFAYVQSYYRCFMKGTPVEQYPFYREGHTENGTRKL